MHEFEMYWPLIIVIMLVCVAHVVLPLTCITRWHDVSIIYLHHAIRACSNVQGCTKCAVMNKICSDERLFVQR